MSLTSTQTGVIGENLLVNAVMKTSDGRLSAFQPVADDDGLDVLFFDKLTGNSIALQLKCRTVTLFKPGTKDRGNSVHFEVRKSTYSDSRRAYLVAGLLNDELTHFETTWFVPMSELPKVARDGKSKWVMRVNKATTSRDRCTPYRCQTVEELVKRIIVLAEANCEAQLELGAQTSSGVVRNDDIGRPAGDAELKK
jgi:hypothetical protein